MVRSLYEQATFLEGQLPDQPKGDSVYDLVYVDGELIRERCGSISEVEAQLEELGFAFDEVKLRKWAKNASPGEAIEDRGTYVLTKVKGEEAFAERPLLGGVSI